MGPMPLLLGLAFILSGVLANAATDTPAMPDSTAEHVHPLLPSENLNLREVLETTYTRYPYLQSIQAHAVEAQALRQHASGLMPDNAALSLSYFNDRPASDQGMEEWEAGVDIPLWLPGQKKARTSLAKSADASSTAAAQALKLKVAGEVRDTLWMLAKQDNERTLAKQAWQAAQLLEKDVDRRFQAGELARSDLMLAQEETLLKHDAYLLADAELKHAQQRYMALTGLTNYPAIFTESRSPKTEIEASHPALTATQTLVEQAMAQARLVREESRDNPELTIGARRERGMTGEDYIDSLGIGVRLPFDSGKRSAARQAGAQRTLAEAEAQRDTLKRELLLNLHEAEHLLAISERELTLSEKRNHIAQDALRMAQIAFKAGEIDLADLVRIQTRAFAAEHSLSRIRLQLQHNIANYNQAVGELP